MKLSGPDIFTAARKVNGYIKTALAKSRTLQENHVYPLKTLEEIYHDFPFCIPDKGQA